MKQRIPNAIYSKEFREQAVKRVQEERLSSKAVAKQLMMPKSTLNGLGNGCERGQVRRGWQDTAASDGDGARVGQG